MPHADLVVLDGRLKTFADPGSGATALAVRDGRIAAVGTDTEIAALRGPGTAVIEARGGTVLPGFCDAHVHVFWGGAELDALSFDGIEGEAAVTEAVRARAAAEPDAPLVFGVGAQYAMLGRPMTRHDLDRILPDRPLAIMAADHHTVWANTAALRAGGILGGGEAPGGLIVMGEDGQAAGALHEVSAFGPVWRMTPHAGRDMAGYLTGDDPEPAPGPAERAADKAAILKGLRHAARHGITTLHNMDGNRYQLELMAELDAELDGGLPVRVQVPFHLKPAHPLDRLAEAADWARDFASDRLWSGRVKMFMDGVMESYTAFMLDPYPARPGSRGEALFAEDHFSEACRRADALGLQIAVHAIGDAAVRRTLDGYAAARAANGPRDHRHRIEHVETVHPDDLPRFAAEGVVASMQPLHSPLGGLFPVPAPDTYLGRDRIPLAFAWRRMRESGARLVFSTDWPVAPLPVMRSVEAAVATRVPEGWDDQAQGLDETLRSCTVDAAWAEFAEDRKGRLAPGYLADVTVLSADLDAVAPGDLGGVTAVATVMGGRITHRA